MEDSNWLRDGVGFTIDIQNSCGSCLCWLGQLTELTDWLTDWLMARERTDTQTDQERAFKTIQDGKYAVGWRLDGTTTTDDDDQDGRRLSLSRSCPVVIVGAICKERNVGPMLGMVRGNLSSGRSERKLWRRSPLYRDCGTSVSFWPKAKLL